MPTTLIAPVVELAAIPRKKWSRAECAHLSSILDLSQYELIDGELIRKMGKNHPHIRALLLLLRWLRSVFPDLHIGHEIPIDVRPDDNPASEPEPDAVVLTRSVVDVEARPTPAEIRLLVEVSDTTLSFDLNQKAALYARAGIVDYWVLDVTGRRLIVHRRPLDGQYREVLGYAESESVAPLAAPESSVSVSSLL